MKENAITHSLTISTTNKLTKCPPIPQLSLSAGSGLLPLLLVKLASSLTAAAAADKWFKLSHTSEYVLFCFFFRHRNYNKCSLDRVRFFAILPHMENN